jgi:hypothetical protein
LVCLSESKHPNFEPDQHDCVTRGCDEGHSCSTISARGVDIGYCDYSAPNAEPTLGCAIRLCESDADCADLQACDPEGPFADGQGCRDLSCVEGRPCPSGWLCDLGKTADISGCYDPGSLPSGGTGGGGTSGSGGTTGSSGGVAGSRNGQCVRR